MIIFPYSVDDELKKFKISDIEKYLRKQKLKRLK